MYYDIVFVAVLHDSIIYHWPLHHPKKEQSLIYVFDSPTHVSKHHVKDVPIICIPTKRLISEAMYYAVNIMLITIIKVQSDIDLKFYGCFICYWIICIVSHQNIGNCMFVFVMLGSGLSETPGPRLNIKTVLSTYGDFHVKDKTAVRTSYL